MYKSQTLRFNVNLDSKNLENYEISLLDLIKTDKPEIQNDNNTGEIDNIENLVKQMEAKYGPVAVVKGKRIRVNDFVDQGNGYDADDPFIDDSGGDEALVVAPDLMTEHGGFFINNDCLKLNEVKFIIDRVEGGSDLMNSPKKSFLHKNINKKSKSQQLLSQARKRLTTSSKSGTATIRRCVTSDNHKLDVIINDIVTIKKVVKNDKMETSPKTVKKSDFNDAQVPNSIQEKDIPIAQQNNIAAQQQTKLLELPTGLSQTILDKINVLVQISEKCKSEGKKIEPHFNSILYELDSMLVNTNQKGMKVIRTNVLRYVSQISDIKYDAILRRISKIKDNKKKQRMRPLFKALEDAIKEAMIDSVSKYDNDMKHYAIKVETQKSLGAMLSENLCVSSDQTTELKPTPNKIKLPKRCFKWTIACKSLLFKLVCGELDTFRISNNKGVPEEYLNKFYQTSVINLFPPKWMTVSQLMKISIPLISEFKQCILNGKEFKNFSPVLKHKPEPKPHSTVNINDTCVFQLKEPILALSKCNSVLDVKVKTTSASLQLKKPITQLKAQPLDIPMIKPPTNTNTLNIAIKNIAPSVHLKSSVNNHKPTVRSSSIIPASRLNNASSILAVKPMEAIKRYPDGQPLSSPNSIAPKRSPDYSGINLVGLSSPNEHSNASLSYLQNYLYPNNHTSNNNINHMEQICRNTVSSTSLTNNLIPHFSQQQTPSSSQHQPHMQPRYSNEFTHHAAYNISPENITRVQQRTQKIPDVSMIFSTPMEITQSNNHHYHHHPPIPPSAQHTHCTNIQRAPNNIQPDHKQCSLGLISPGHEFSPIKSGHSHYSLNSSPMIDLTQSDIPTNTHIPQLSPSVFINMNKAHCPNARHFQNQ